MDTGSADAIAFINVVQAEIVQVTFLKNAMPPMPTQPNTPVPTHQLAGLTTPQTPAHNKNYNLI